MPNSKIEIQNPNSKITNPQFPNRKSKIQISKRNHNPKSQPPHLTPEIRIPKSKIPNSKIQNPKSEFLNPKSKIQNPNFKPAVQDWILNFKLNPHIQNWNPEFKSDSSSSNNPWVEKLKPRIWEWILKFKVESSTWKLKLGIPDQIRLINAISIVFFNSSDGLSWIAEIFFVNATPKKAKLILTQYLKKYSRLHLST